MAHTAFIGVGNMGGPMSRNLANSGQAVKIFDLSPVAMQAVGADNATPSQSASVAVEGATTVVTMLPEGKHVRAAYLDAGGILDTAEPGTLFIDCSTIDVASARAVAAEAKARGFRMIDAPVSGGTVGADAATLTFMIGGEAEDIEAARPQLEKMGKTIVHCGPSGNGQAAKICNNMIGGITMIAVSEAFCLGERLGISAEDLQKVVAASSGSCFAVTNYLPVAGPTPASPANFDFKAGFMTKLMLKDMRLSQMAAVETGQPSPLGAQAAMLYAMAEQEGLADLDYSSIIKLFNKGRAV
ncbi:MAG: 3-hydroxyisobutyrate dehydrogenase [Alphaproteobacteria bacterium]|jgi:3-hydroxyisobutyrate dehydrogenase